MANTFRLRRFSDPSILKSISRPLLLRFLKPYRSFLADRGLRLPKAGDVNFDKLAQILISPAEDTPEELMNALFFVDEMSMPTLFDELSDCAASVGIDIATDEKPTAADIAVKIWLKDPDALQSMHAEGFLTKAKSFKSFLSLGKKIPTIRKATARVRAALEDDLNDWFDKKRRGRGARVFIYPRDDLVWFLVRHGEPYKREGTLENGEPGSIFYRPEKFDVIIYNRDLGELAIHAGTKGEMTAYCELIGKHLFGSQRTFDVEEKGGKFSLEPIRASGRKCLVCADVDGIENVELVELHIRHDSDQYHVETHKAADVFRALDEIMRQLPDDARLVMAKFRVKFRNAVRPRTVVLRPPNVAIFDRESDSDILNDWLTKRGFIQIRRADADDSIDAALEVA